MALNARKAPGGGSKQDPVEPGTYPARLVQVIGLGTQQQEYMGEKKTPRYELWVTYELLDEFMKDEDGNEDEEKPRWISERFALHNLDADKAKSTARYYALDPTVEKDGEWGDLLGTPCMVTIVQNEGKGRNKGKVYNNVAAVSSMRQREADKAPELVNPTALFDMDEPDMEVWDKLPDFLQDIIKESLDYDGSVLQEKVVAKGDSKSSDDKDDWD
jgi:hypothetical protein